MSRRLPFTFVWGRVKPEPGGPVCHYGILIRNPIRGREAIALTVRLDGRSRWCYDIMTDRDWLPAEGQWVPHRHPTTWNDYEEGSKP